jgi:nucleoside-diphosphate-sugar epimerase
MTATILVTGSAGRIGQAVVQALGEEARGFDRVPTPGHKDHVVGDLSDGPALARAMQGIGTVIHLAATPDDVADVVGELFPSNIVGVYHLFEAARQAGVQRLILASSGQVVWYQRQRGPLPVTAEVQPTPRYWYAATKMFLEAAGRAFHETHGMSVIIARLGWCPRTVEQVQEIAASTWAQDVYLSPNDAGRFFRLAAHAPESVRWAIVYPTSKPVHQRPYDAAPLKQLIGYEAQEQWPQGIEIITGVTGERRQGEDR